MFQNKAKFLILLLLAIFVSGNSLALLHGFSHNISSDKSFDGHKNPAENPGGNSEKKSEHCLLCAFVNFQTQILFSGNYSFAISGFILIFSLKFFNLPKAAITLSSNHSRAPPHFS